MKKNIVLILLVLLNILNADGFAKFKSLNNQKFLKPSEAFKVKTSSNKNGLEINISLGNKIHIYKDELKAKIIKPISKDINLNLPKGKDISGKESYDKNLTIVVPNSEIGINGDYTLKVTLLGCSDSGICYSPQQYEFNLTNFKKNIGENKKDIKKDIGFFEKISNITDSGNSKDIAMALKKEGIFFILLLFLIFGILLALTPCILPMVPILSSILLKQANKKEGGLSRKEAFFISLIYVVSMAATYAVIGIVAGLLNFDLQSHANNPWVIIPVALIFIALAFSLFGYYRIELPANLQTKLHNISSSAEGKGYIGTAIMGAISALIVGACTAPVISGAIIFISMTGDAILGGLALFIMGLGAGLPLLLLGIGAKTLVPKPGGWMYNVSKFFGFLMLLMALYIARGIIDDTIFIYALSILFIGSGLLFGALDTKQSLFKVVAFLMLIYGVILFIGAIAGAKSTLKPLEPFTSKVITANTQKIHKAKKYTLNSLLAEIKNSNKPTILDIGKDNCAACTELETITFPDKNVIEELKRFKFIKLDITDYTKDDQEIMKHFNLFGAPNILVFNSNGEHHKEKNMQGFIEPKKFINIIKDVK